MDFADLMSAKAVTMRPGVVRRTLVHGDRMLLVHWQLAAGVHFGEHSHPYEQAGYVLRGSMELVVEDRRQPLRGGSGYVVASGVLHDAYVVEDTEVLDIFSPVRREYI